MVRHINNAVGMFNAGENLRAYQTDGGSLTKDEGERRNSTIIPMAGDLLLRYRSCIQGPN